MLVERGRVGRVGAGQIIVSNLNFCNFYSPADIDVFIHKVVTPLIVVNDFVMKYLYSYNCRSACELS